MKRLILVLVTLFLFIGMNARESLTFVQGKSSGQVAIMTSAIDHQQKRLVDALIKSVRRFGGKYANCPIYVGIPDWIDFPYDSLMKKGVTLLKINADKRVGKYLFAFKALAAAKVEERVRNDFNTLIWFDSGVIILGELNDLDLNEVNASAVFRPVSLTNNVGLTKIDPLNEYWGRIYQETGLKFEEVPYMKTIVDQVEVKAYLNCQVYSINPKLGLLKEWGDLLEKLVLDKDYQAKACTGFWHRVFLHQAVLSSLVLSKIPSDKIHNMSLKYSYPVNQVKRMDPSIIINRMNDVKVVVFDERWARDSLWMREMTIEEPLKEWLSNTYIDYIKLTENLYRIEDSCNSYLITTNQGSVLIDPNGASSSAWFKRIIKNYPLKVILITHAHADHWDNMKVWKTNDKLKIIAQRKFVDYIDYTDRFKGFFARRNAIWQRKSVPKVEIPNKKTPIEPNVFFADNYKFELGGFHFELYHTPGESPDHTTIWIPELKAVFVGDNYYEYFINNATFRGTTTRPVLGYISALDAALAFKPMFFLPGHGKPIVGSDTVESIVTRFNNALKYIHNETVKGMNSGKDVYTLMEEIKLPLDLRVAPYFGKVSWTVRGIYNEYAGWFDENPATMYSTPPSSVYSDIVKLSGGPDKIFQKAEDYLKEKEFVKTLHITQIILTSDPTNKKANEIRLKALKKLKSSTFNYIERIWLDHEVNQIQQRLKN